MANVADNRLSSIVAVGLSLLLGWLILAFVTPAGENVNDADLISPPYRFESGRGKIVYTSGGRTSFGIWSIEDLDDPHPTVVYDSRRTSAREPAWSPDGSLIAFVSDCSLFGSSDLFVIELRSQTPRRLKHTPGLWEHFPAWSPDGHQLVFAAKQIETRPFQLRWDLYLINSDGRNLHRLLDTMNIDEFDPYWHPDGTRIIFAARSNTSWAKSDLYTIDAAGVQEPVRLTETDEFGEREPRWSPDGSRILFTRVNAEWNADIWMMNADGSNAVNLTPNTPSHDFNPRWSPDGEHILFTSDRDYGQLDLFVMQIDGSEVHPIEIPDRLRHNELEGDWWGPAKDRTPTPTVSLVPTTISTPVETPAGTPTSTPTATTTPVQLYTILVPVIQKNWDGCLHVDISEPNNSISRARGPLCAERVYHATIESEEDQDDIYWIRTSRAGTLVVDLKSIPPGADYDLAVYDENVAKVGESTATGNAGERVEVSVSAGKYYIQVHRFEGFNATDPYELQWSLQ